jgi:magnesium-transporting ATPase (P-type)
MLTGDKQETCISVAIACGLVNEENVLILNSDSVEGVQQQILTLMERIKVIFKKSLQLKNAIPNKDDNNNNRNKTLQEMKKRIFHYVNWKLPISKKKTNDNNINLSKIRDKQQKNRPFFNHEMRIGLVIGM